jgi:RNA polymerase sigma-32 factor
LVRKIRKSTTKRSGKASAGAKHLSDSKAHRPTPETRRGADDTPIEVEDFHPVDSNESSDSEPAAAVPIDRDEDNSIEESATTPERDDDNSASIEDSAERASALVYVDPLSRYLAEIRRFPILSREDEQVISRRYVRDRDPQDAYRLVTANLRLVVKIAYEFSRATRNVLDLVQEGNVGLMEALKKFDPARGIRFPSYAVWWVRAYIYRYLLNNWRLVKIGTTQAQRKLFFNLRKETERLESEGFKPQPLLIAQRMGVKESEVREMQQRMAQNEVSLDQPVSPGEETPLLDAIVDSRSGPEELVAASEFRNFAHDKIRRFEATLKDKELEIFRDRLLAEEPVTLAAIGERHGVSRERVRQIESRLKRRLKEFIESADASGSGAG